MSIPPVSRAAGCAASCVASSGSKGRCLRTTYRWRAPRHSAASSRARGSRVTPAATCCRSATTVPRPSPCSRPCRPRRIRSPHYGSRDCTAGTRARRRSIATRAGSPRSPPHAASSIAPRWSSTASSRPEAASEGTHPFGATRRYVAQREPKGVRPLRSPAEFVEDRVRGGKPCRCVGGFEAKAQPRRAVESVTAAGPLDEADDTVGRDPVIWDELDDATRRAELETTDTEPGGTLPQPVDDEQRARRRRQRAETIDQLGLEVVETLAVGGTRHALVELQAQVHVRDVILRQQGGQLQVDFAAGRGRRVERRLPAFAQGSHRALEKLEVEAETDLLDLSGLFLAEQLAGAANLEVLG